MINVGLIVGGGNIPTPRRSGVLEHNSVADTNNDDHGVVTPGFPGIRELPFDGSGPPIDRSNSGSDDGIETHAFLFRADRRIVIANHARRGLQFELVVPLPLYVEFALFARGAAAHFNFSMEPVDFTAACHL